jgi:hypothetical protein
MCLSIAMPLTHEDLKQDIDRLNSQQLQQVADFIAFLQYRDQGERSRVNRSTMTIEPHQFAAIAEFADDDRAMAEAGMSDYTSLLAQEGEP